MSNIITLTTDWNNSDYYISAVKAKIISNMKDATIIDISHNIEQFSIIQAAFVLKSVYKNFPDNTVHLICVDSIPDKSQQIIIAKFYSQYFICNDNGCLGLIFDEKPEIAISIDIDSEIEDFCFIEKGLFSKLACYISKGKDIKLLGDEIYDIKRKLQVCAQIEEDYIEGIIIYIDSYQNVISNISKELFEKYIGDKKFVIQFSTNSQKIKKISYSYKDVEAGGIVCIFNSLGLLEVAVREGKAAQLLGLERKDAIRIKLI